ncbi:MAG: GntR family transcriptional regulator, partial [Candidatus Dormiibacterota bacterium]
MNDRSASRSPGSGANPETTARSKARRSPSNGQTTIAVEAIDRIRDLIITRHWGPGERLPNETDLAAQLGLSRNSLREAVRALALIRVLDVRQGDGTYVSSLEPALLLESMRMATNLLPDRTLVELFEVRRFLEPPATGLAAARCTADDLGRLREDLQQMYAAPTIEDLVEVDTRFHRRVALASGNQTLASLLD